MKITLNKKEFLKELEKIIPIALSKNEAIMSQNVLIECLKNRIKITASNPIDSLVTYCNAIIEEPLDMCIPANKLFEIINSFSNDSIIVKSDNEYNLKISDKKSKFSLKGSSAEEFTYTIIQHDDNSNKIEMNVDMLSDMIRKTIYAVSVDQSRYNLMGINFDINKNIIKTCATNGRVISLIKNNINYNGENEVFIIGTNSCLSLLKLLSKTKGDLSIIKKNNNIIFNIEETIFITKTIDGKFPDITRMIPKKFNEKIIINKQVFESIHRRSLIVKEQTQIGQMIATFKDNKVIFESRSLSMSNLCFNEEMDVNYNGDELKISYQIEYILDFLKNSVENEIILNYNGSINPFMLTQNIENNNYLNIVSPMRIS